MTENLYTQYANKYYNPNDDGKKPGDNENWESIQKGFSRIGSTQLETSEGLTLGKGTEDETSVTAAELEEIKNPTELETSGGLTLGKGTADEVSVTAAELGEMKDQLKDAISFTYRFIAQQTIIAAASHVVSMGSILNKLTGKLNPGYYVPVANGSYTTSVQLTPKPQAGAFSVLRVNPDGSIDQSSDWETFTPLTNNEQYAFELRNNTSNSVNIPVGYMIVISFVQTEKFV